MAVLGDATSWFWAAANGGLPAEAAPAVVVLMSTLMLAFD
jgi:hypothetical protein